MTTKVTFVQQDPKKPSKNCVALSVGMKPGFKHYTLIVTDGGDVISYRINKSVATAMVQGGIHYQG